MLPAVIGVVAALLVGLLGRISGMDRDRVFYPVAMIVIASYYVLFALLGHSTQALVIDAAIGAIFVVMAVAGFRRSLWLVVVALAAHGVMDAFHTRVIDNPGLPPWWPAWCAAYDLVAAAFLAWLLRSGRVPTALTASRSA